MRSFAMLACLVPLLLCSCAASGGEVVYLQLEDISKYDKAPFTTQPETGEHEISLIVINAQPGTKVVFTLEVQDDAGTRAIWSNEALTEGIDFPNMGEAPDREVGRKASRLAALRVKGKKAIVRVQTGDGRSQTHEIETGKRKIDAWAIGFTKDRIIFGPFPY